MKSQRGDQGKIYKNGRFFGRTTDRSNQMFGFFFGKGVKHWYLEKKPPQHGRGPTNSILSLSPGIDPGPHW